MALTNKLSAIGDAIREKTGKTELLTLDAMPLEIASITTGGGGGDIEVEPIVLSDDCSYACAGDMASTFIKLFGNKVSTKNITTTNNMFYNYKNDTVPFEININYKYDYQKGANLTNLFYMSKLKELPKIKGPMMNANAMFSNCYYLREIPMDYFDTIDRSHIKDLTSAYDASCNSIFNGCYSLRRLPLDWLKDCNKNGSYSTTYFYQGFQNCASLDELINLPIPYTAMTSNMFYYCFNYCSRLKNLTFEVNEDGSPLERNWKSQTIDLTIFVGRGYTNTTIISYNSGITNKKEVIDDATYQALKDDPDWFATGEAYSRYNHDSAVSTINSLPDTSAYLATAGGTNTIKFKPNLGSKTDGGAINTLTAEEIAVATAKGWTVTLS